MILINDTNRHETLSVTQVRIYSEIESLAMVDRRPTIKGLARACKCPQATVRRALNRLADIGWITLDPIRPT